MRARIILLFPLLALVGCRIATSYTPRTAHVAALGIRNGEPGIYKGGVLTPLASGAAATLVCSPTAMAMASSAADHHASYRSNLTLGSVFYALGAFFPPMMSIGIYFAARAGAEQQEARVDLIDAINRHNDDPACAAQVVGRIP
jgi:hypothetical protein